MSIGFPFPIYGRTYDSNGQLLANTIVYTTSGSTTLTMVSNSGGKYVGNIMDYANSGCYMSSTAIGKCEKFPKAISKVIVSSMGINFDINLTEANTGGSVSMNTARDYNNKMYIFTPLCNKVWCKTINE